MEFIADFHIHSKYSRATSRDMDIEHIVQWAKLKGITLMGTGDFTHHIWLEELKNQLEDLGNGLFKYRDVYFILTTEISSIYSKKGRTYRIHNIIFSPSFKSTDKINEKLCRYGNLASDGRPILGMDAHDLARIIFDIDENCMVVPAHCLLPGILIHTSKGMKAIESITHRDYIYTHKLQYKKITQVFSREYKGDILHIRPYYFREGLKVTPEHPFYIIKTYKNCPSRNSFCMPKCAQLKNKGCKRQYFNQYQPQWVQARDIEIGDVMIFPKFNKKVRDRKTLLISDFIKGEFILKKGKVGYKGSRTNFIRNKIKTDKDFCRLSGYFISEGYTNSRDCVSFCFSEKEKDYIKDVTKLMRRIFGVESLKMQLKKDVKGIELIFYSKVLCNLFSRLFYCKLSPSKKAFSKCLPRWMLELPYQKQKEIIEGWWRGDKGYTASRVLMNQMKVLFLRLDIIPSIGLDTIEKHKFRGKHFLGTREVLARHNIYCFNSLSFFNDNFNLLKTKEFRRFKTKLSARHGWVDGKYVYMPVRDISREEYQGLVYNLEVDKDNSYVCEFATVHNCWTPWFSLFGSMSGFDKIEDCFEDQTPKIFALETGLSSDPAMNWRLSALDKFTLISNSDSHSPSKIGREANVFDCQLDYKTIREVLKTKDKKRFLSTIEFFPEEGKYHFDGHRLCGIRFSPKETRQNNGKCPKCGKPLTVGVMNRVEQLADRPEGYNPSNAITYKNLIPFDEIIAEAKGVSKTSVGVERDYRIYVDRFGTEFDILLRATKEDLLKSLPPQVAEGVLRARSGKVKIQAGFDGEYGIISLFDEGEGQKESEKQLSLF